MPDLFDMSAQREQALFDMREEQEKIRDRQKEMKDRQFLQGKMFVAWIAGLFNRR